MLNQNIPDNSGFFGFNSSDPLIGIGFINESNIKIECS